MGNRVLAISGLAGAGKTTTAEALAARLAAPLLRWDDFDEVSVAPADYVAWHEAGKPEGLAAWKYPQLAESLRALKAGETVLCPKTQQRLTPSPWIVFDAPLGRNHEETGAHIDFWVDLATPLDVALGRRLLRDFTPTDAAASILNEVRHYLERSRPLFAYTHTLTPDLTIDGTLPTARQVDLIGDALATSPVIKPLAKEACQVLAHGFLDMGWSKPAGQFETYYREQERGKRLVLVAFVEGAFAGYLTILWESQYPRFAMQGIPEINDLNVLPRFRCRGIASRLLDAAERECGKRSATIGIGVGLYADYGAAQRIYMGRGYNPDGCGITYHNTVVQPGATVAVDDDLVLWFTKTLL